MNHRILAGIFSGMGDQFNTVAGWVLAAGIAVLGLSIVSGEQFTHHAVEKGGYPVEATEESGGDIAKVEPPIGQIMAAADPAKGEEVFKKCTSCHTISAGGASGTGPNLHGILGKGIAKAGGFAYSGDLAAVGGTWDWAKMNQWLKKPKSLAAGTKMSFAGISKPEDRANLMAYLNSQGSNVAKPAVEAAAAAPAAKAAAQAH
jgi:cytochrome c